MMHETHICLLSISARPARKPGPEKLDRLQADLGCSVSFPSHRKLLDNNCPHSGAEVTLLISIQNIIRNIISYTELKYETKEKFPF